VNAKVDASFEECNIFTTHKSQSIKAYIFAHIKKAQKMNWFLSLKPIVKGCLAMSFS
jgi:hypothetical protein